MGGEKQRITSEYVQREAFLRLFGNYQQFNGRVALSKIVGGGLGMRKAFHGNFWVCRKEQVLLVRRQPQHGPGLLSLRRPEDFKINFMRDNENIRLFKFAGHLRTLNDRGIYVP